MFEDDEPCEEDKPYFKSNRIYRKWPFLAWLFMGIVTGSGLILLASGPDSTHFIDPSAKMIIGMGLFMILSFKLFHKMVDKRD